MNLLLVVFLLLICLLISNIIGHYIPSIPTALMQVFLGILLSPFASTSFEFNIETGLFLLLFVAPLLYNDGRHYPREELWKMRAQIFGNAIFLVLLTTIAGGYLIHWIIPSIPLAASFALAAVLSPTDPVAVKGITKRINVPDSVMGVVRGESLINDASGLVCFKYATLAAVTGYISIKGAAINFFYIFTVGALAGLILGTLITWTIYSLRKHGISDVSLFSLMSLITPFLIYFISEHILHASGVIAVVVAGVLHALISDSIEFRTPKEKLLTENLWSMISFVLNGIMFLLLGLNIPTSMKQTVMDSSVNNYVAIWDVILTFIFIYLIRFIWTYATECYYRYKLLKRTPNLVTFKTSLIMTLSGVRGAVTMAAVLSLPYSMENGAIFQSRPLILFIAAGVILLSLVVATILLPLLNNEPEIKKVREHKMKLSDAKRKILLNVIKQIRSSTTKTNEVAACELLNEYMSLFGEVNSTREQDTSDSYLQEMMEVRLVGIRAERKYIENMLKDGFIDQETFEFFDKSLNYQESTIINDFKSNFVYVIRKAIHEWRQTANYPQINGDISFNQLQFSKYVQLKAAEHAIKKIEELALKDYNINIIRIVILDYRKLINKLKTSSYQYSEKIEEQKEALRIKIVDMERHEVHTMYESGEITAEQAKELRRFINYTEIITLYEHTN